MGLPKNRDDMYNKEKQIFLMQALAMTLNQINKSEIKLVKALNDFYIYYNISNSHSHSSKTKFRKLW